MLVVVVMIVLTSIFVIIILGAMYELWRSDRRYRKRKELEENAQRIYHQSTHVSFPESGVKVVSFKKVSIIPKRGQSEKKFLPGGNQVRIEQPEKLCVAI